MDVKKGICWVADILLPKSSAANFAPNISFAGTPLSCLPPCNLRCARYFRFLMDQLRSSNRKRLVPRLMTTQHDHATWPSTYISQWLFKDLAPVSLVCKVHSTCHWRILTSHVEDSKAHLIGQPTSCTCSWQNWLPQSMGISGSNRWRYRFHIFLAYVLGLCKGISPEHMAKHMVQLSCESSGHPPFAGSQDFPVSVFVVMMFYRYFVRVCYWRWP